MTAPDDTPSPAPKRPANGPRCPVCGRSATGYRRRFCSRRCADIDLGRWLTGAYVIPAAPGEEDDGPSLA
ncbi:MAG: DNA gyrase inhibitor YacG [Alphaproteobacteria bacterium]|nr:DNA gyrase inhibitor YacG [Alphaproteobacteria bacterium]MDP6518070.1 DNA gyrase inhibitor YacG [Alphaproteobacteria bacterium]